MNYFTAIFKAVSNVISSVINQIDGFTTSGNLRRSKKDIIVNRYNSVCALLSQGYSLKKLPRTIVPVRFYVLPQSYLRILTNSLQTPHNINANDLLELTVETKNLSPNLLLRQEWIVLYEILCVAGLYESAYYVRKNSTLADQKFSNRQSSPIQGLPKQIEADVKLNKSLFKRLVEVNFESDVRAGAHDQYPNSHVSTTTQDSDAKGLQPAALVGPTVPNAANANKIDNFGCVARINYTHTGKGCDGKYKGFKTTHAYFNGEQTRTLVKADVKPCDISHAIFKCRTFKKTRIRWPSVRIREMADFDLLAFHGTYNMVPLAILDLLSSGYGPVSVFNVDLMLSVDRETGYYPDDFKRTERETLKRLFREGSAIHDPVTQFVLLKRLMIEKWLVPDDELKKVLNLNAAEYMCELQKGYRV